MMKGKVQNNCLNLIKGCACFGIVYMHTSYDCLFSSIISCLVRFGVLIFFMVSGYYCYHEENDIVQKSLPRKIIHILKICFFSTLIYIVADLFVYPLFGANRPDFILYFKSLISIDNLWKLLFLNKALVGGPLWFLFALLYCYLLLWIINKKDLYHVAYALIPILIFLHIVSRGVIQYFHIFDEEINILFYRNFVFMGYPFFMLGNWIHRNEKKLLEKTDNKKLIILIVIGLLISCIERFIVPLELYWGTVLATYSMFVFAIKNPRKKIIPIVAYIGEKYMLAIYIMHPIVNHMFWLIKHHYSIEDNVILAFLNPLFVYIIISVFCYSYYNIKGKRIDERK